MLYIEGNQFYFGIKDYENQYTNNKVLIENSHFEENSGIENLKCSSMYVKCIDNITLNDTTFIDNNCTGIVLYASTLKVLNRLNIIRNSGVDGGAIQMRPSLVYVRCRFPSMKYSQLNLTKQSQLHIVNNTSTTCGGGLFIDETCKKRNEMGKCFFQIVGELLLKVPNVLFHFEGNEAREGGDIIFGGCLSNCSISQLDNINHTIVDITKEDNVFRKLVQSSGFQTPSRFAEHPDRVVFCKNTSMDNNTICTNSSHVTAYRGLLFNVSLMVVDEHCHSSVGIVHIEAEPNHMKDVQFGKGQNPQETKKYCNTYSYTVNSSQDSVQLHLLLKGTRPAELTVHFKDCPFGFQLNKEQGSCECPQILRDNKIQCSIDHSLTVPSLTWVGGFQEKVAVRQDCHYCKAEGNQVISYLLNDSDKICVRNRRGTLCGACAGGYDLKLGGYGCDDCSNSTYKGVLLILLFIFLGLLLVITLLKLNLTVSTGFINAFIFYSNIVYSNHDIFLPINNESNNVHLNNAVSALYTFQAWINLDFGFDVCFFDGLDTYQATWMQFIFPLYIWVLILIVIFSSRFSMNVSRLIGENAVSVLATLFLLSYTKLLLTIISVFSYITLSLDNGKRSHPLWVPDANIKYLSDKHIPLFIVGVLMTLFYIIPFTLLIAFGPILQAKSEYRIFKWINKIKPFLDAFYGPYTDKYRYWPGLLLITRVILLNMFAFYSLGDTVYKLASMLVTTSLLFVIWILSGLYLGISPYIYNKKSLNYMEVFFLLNLVTYSVTSLYFKSGNPNTIERQQTLAIITVGSAFVVFCGILVYHVAIIAFRFKVTHKIIDVLIPEIVKKYITSRSTSKETPSIEIDCDTSSTTPTSTSFEFTELREPLLN